jgi:hypothetical protein
VVPEANRNDVLLNPLYKERVAITYAATLAQALEASLEGPKKAAVLARLDGVLRGGSPLVNALPRRRGK